MEKMKEMTRTQRIVLIALGSIIVISIFLIIVLLASVLLNRGKTPAAPTATATLPQRTAISQQTTLPAMPTSTVDPNATATSTTGQPATQAPLGSPVIELNPTSGAPGSQVTVVGRNWPPNQQLILGLAEPQGAVRGDAMYGAIQVEPDGTFTIAFVVPDEERWNSLPQIDFVVAAPDFSLEARQAYWFVPFVPTDPSSGATATDDPLISPAATATSVASIASPTAAETVTITNWKGEYFDNTNLSGSPVLVQDDEEVNFDWGTDAPHAALPADNFSARWTRTLQFEAGNYRFEVAADDGVRLWINDELLIDRWSDADGQTSVSEVALDGGYYSLRVEYLEKVGAAQISLDWETYFTGWRGQYFDNTSLDGNPKLVRDDAEIDFDWEAGSPPDIPAENFSARWTRDVTFAAGSYTFYAMSDDGVRVWVDNNLIIDQWVDGYKPSVNSEPQSISAGYHTVKVEYYENTGDAKVAVWWDRTPVITEWRGEYYGNRNLTGEPVIVRNDRSVDFNWGADSPHDLIPADNFSARWTRQLNFQGGDYDFYSQSDDGIRVWVDDTKVIDRWDEGSGNGSGQYMDLAAGTHTVKIEYYELTGGAKAQVTWQKREVYTHWKGEYFNNRDFSGSPILTRNDRSIDFDWGANSPATGVQADNFAVRWTREIPFEGGNYIFHANVDDGVRIWLGDELIIDSWRDGTGSVQAEYYNLATDDHQIKIEYFEHTGNARAKVWWESLATTGEWRARYYNNRDLSGDPVLTRNEEEVDFDWDNDAPYAGISADNFSARWTRTLHFERGDYIFHAKADDGVRVYIDDTLLLLNAWSDGQHELSEELEGLSTGDHKITVEYYEKTGDAEVKVWWEPQCNNWRGEYFNTNDLQGDSRIVCEDERLTFLDFNWVGAAPLSGMNADNFSVRWERTLWFDGGDYRFYGRADDGVLVWIDDILVVNLWQDNTGEFSVNYPLTEGNHNLRVEYYERTDNARIRLAWERFTPTTVPPTATPTPTPSPTASPTTSIPTANLTVNPIDARTFNVYGENWPPETAVTLQLVMSNGAVVNLPSVTTNRDRSFLQNYTWNDSWPAVATSQIIAQANGFSATVSFVFQPPAAP